MPVMEAPVNLVCDFLSFMAGTVYFAVDVSCFIGYLIVRNCFTLFSVIFQATSYILNVFQVIIEDYCIFMSDLFTTLCSMAYCVELFLESVYLIYYYLLHLGSLMYSSVAVIVYCAIGAISSVGSMLLYVLQSFLDVYILFRNTALLVGSSVWDIVTGVPQYVYSLVYECLLKGINGVHLVNVYIHQHLVRLVFEPHIIFLNCYSLVKSCLLLIPFKPICGLSLAVSFLCIVVKKRRSLLNFAYRTWLSVTTRSQQVVVCVWQTFEGYVLWLLTNQRRDWQRIPLNERFNDLMIGEIETDHDSEEAADSDSTDGGPHVTHRKRGTKDHMAETTSEEVDASLCVVCQDKTRSILTLPCRHVCLCSTCCTAVRAHQGLCPLCRQEINFAGRVYL